jgi:hypothetical protein
MSADEERQGTGQPAEFPSSAGPDRVVDYELTAMDAGWRSPTFLVSRTRLTIFDPPRPIKRDRESRDL